MPGSVASNQEGADRERSDVAAALAARLALGEPQQEARERLLRAQSALLDSTGEAIYGLDEAGCCVFINRAAQKTIGYQAEELLGRHLHETIHHSRADGSPYPPEECPVNLTLATGTAVERDDEVLWRRDGSHFPAEYSSHPIYDGARVAGVVVVFRDISGRRQEEARTRFLLQAGRVLVESLDYEATLERVAELAVPEIADWAAVHLVDAGERLRPVAVVHRDPRRRTLVEDLRRRVPFDLNEPAGPARVVRTGRPELLERIPADWFTHAPRLDEEGRRTAAALQLCSSLTVPLRARGNVLGTMSLVYAESGRHYTRADLSFAEDLADRAGLAIDNARLFRDVRDAMHLRDDLLATVSHDLRTPLTIVRGLTQLARRRAVRTAGAEPIAETLERVDAATDRMAVMIEGLLDLSRLSSGRPLELNLDRIDLSDLVRQLVDDLQRGNSQHQFVVETPAAPFYGSWDLIRLTRVLSNLLTNAVKYSPDGGEIHVSLSGEQDAIGAEQARIEVSDHGIGIPAADLPRIFERFQRGSNVVDRIFGIGLGLAGAKQIVEQHGGSMSVESEEGEGARFTVRLPVRPAEPPGE